jgi:hypothetical protein
MSQMSRLEEARQKMAWLAFPAPFHGFVFCFVFYLVHFEGFKF